MGEVLFFVKGNGMGLDGEAKENLFHILKRLHPSDRFEGIGIWLFIVDMVTRRHRDRIFAKGISR